MNESGTSGSFCAVADPARRRAVFRPTPTEDDTVYFLFSAGLIKIGYTADMPGRVAQLGNMSGSQTTLIAALPGNKVLEKSLHRAFKADRAHGEWFRPSEDIRRFLGAVDDNNKVSMPPLVWSVVGSSLERLEFAERHHTPTR